MQNSAPLLLRRLDAPIRFLSFSLEDVVGYSAPMFLGILADNLFWMPILGTLGIFLIKRALRNFPKFTVMRFFYWSLPTETFNRAARLNLPASHYRIWVK